MNDLKEIGGFIVSADPFVQHDTSLSGNGTVNSPLGVVPGYNETVLWSGNAGTANFPLTLNEPLSNFESVKFYWKPWTDGSYLNQTVSEFGTLYNTYTLHDTFLNTRTNSYFLMVDVISANDTSLKNVSGCYNVIGSTGKTISQDGFAMYKVIGINRKQ